MLGPPSNPGCAPRSRVSLRPLVWLLALAAAAPMAARAGEVATPPRRDAEQTTEDGNFLPWTTTARIGDQRVSALVMAGYDTSHNDVGSGGLAGGLWVEGAIFNRVALRAGVDYLTGSRDPAPYGGIRVGILRQERFGIDLGVMVLYKNVGFSEPSGELELIVAVARRWGRVGLFGNLAYGQGLDRTGFVDDRDAEARVAVLVRVHDRVNVGLDARARIDLGDGPAANAPPDRNAADLDFVGGPVASLSLGPVVLLAQAGLHTIVAGAMTTHGVIATGGLGASF